MNTGIKNYELDITDTDIDAMKRQIMGRIFFIHGARKLKSPFIVRSAILLSLVLAESFFVSIPHVIGNMLSVTHDFQSSVSFLITNFINTRLIVQVVALGLLSMVLLVTTQVTASLVESLRLKRTIPNLKV